MNAKTLAKALKQADIQLVVEQDETDYRGHFDSGDSEQDRQLEAEISERLDRGDVWAWCCVKVVATVELYDVEYRGESNWLGGCCYRDEKEFRTPGDYFDDMKAEALEALTEQLTDRPLDPSSIRITRDAQCLALADLLNRELAYRSAEVEVIRQKLLSILKPA